MFEFIFLTFIGFIFIFIGLRIWRNEQKNLIHKYHYKNVAEIDIKAYTKEMGKACIIIGIGMILTGFIDMITNSLYGWVFFALFFLWGLITMLLAQMKYNGGLF